MAMLAEVVDAVVGTDTHRDTHELEIAHPTGAVIDTRSISNDTGGYAQAVGWIAEHTPGPRVVVAVEGTRSYGAALTRALTEAGLTVIECEQPTRAARRGKGKSDTIDAQDRARLASAPAHIHVHHVTAGHWLHVEAPSPVIELFVQHLA